MCAGLLPGCFIAYRTALILQKRLGAAIQGWQRGSFQQIRKYELCVQITHAEGANVGEVVTSNKASSNNVRQKKEQGAKIHLSVGETLGFQYKF